jgi:protein-tyrosine phosphatase
MSKKLLFICTANVKRSVTAEVLFSVCPNIETKSAGTHASSNSVQVNQELVDWADIIFVVSEEEGHISFLKENFNIDVKKIINLDIPDMYYTHDPKLKELLIEKVAPHIDLSSCLSQLLEEIK